MKEVQPIKQKLVIVLSLGLITLFGFFFLSGYFDWHGSEQLHLDLSLMNEVPGDYPILNITNVNFTRYPTLKQAIDSAISSSDNSTSISIKISSEEKNRIDFELLNPSKDLYYFHISYYQYYFNIGFSVN